MKLCQQIAFALFMMSMNMGASAQSQDPDPEAQKVATRFLKLAGSEENAVALVLALRHGVGVHLFADDAPAAESVAIEIDSPPMAYNEVRVALLHVQDVLVRAGYTRPSAEQVRAALLGGDIRTAEGRPLHLRGILPMRHDGLSWVDVARESSPAFLQPVVRTGH